MIVKSGNGHVDERLQGMLDRGWGVDTVSGASNSGNAYWIVILRKTFESKEEYQAAIHEENEISIMDAISEII